MEEDRIKKALKFSMILFEIMFFIAVYWLVCSRISVWEQGAVLRSLGIFTGVVFLFLCPIEPVCGVICGCAGYFGLKKMASKGLITKEHSPIDARITLVKLTEYGAKTIEEMRDGMYQQMGIVIDTVGEERLLEFITIAEEIKNAITPPKFDF